MIIGVCGLIGSGKGTVADFLVDDYGFVKVSFADALKDSVALLFNWDRKLLEGDTEESRAWREQKDDFWSNELDKEVTPRLVLQLFGTECMRHGFYDGIWVSLVKKKLLESTGNFVLPDTRFLNEMNMIRSLGGLIWEVQRELPDWFQKYKNDGIEPIGVHRSEWEWIRGPIDRSLLNVTDIGDLKKMVAKNINMV
jgi:hypothetical protein